VLATLVGVFDDLTSPRTSRPQAFVIAAKRRTGQSGNHRMRSPRLISRLARWFRAGDVHGAGSLSETGSTDTEASSTAGMPLRQVLLDGGDRGVLAGLVSVAHRHPQRSLIRDGGSGAPSPVLPRSQFGGRPLSRTRRRPGSPTSCRACGCYRPL
jgi:hypothetical protein